MLQQIGLKIYIYIYVKIEADLDLEGNSNPSAIGGATGTLFCSIYCFVLLLEKYQSSLKQTQL